MIIKVVERKVVNEVQTLNVEFPYYGWWDGKKDSIVKMYPVYYQYSKHKISHINVIKIQHGFAINSRITCEKINAGENNVISEEINYVLRDYPEPATEADFQKFRQSAIEVLQ